MSSTSDVQFHSGIGQAGKPDMQGMRWGATHLTLNLLSKPLPRLVEVEGLYIDWGDSIPNLTPMPLYGSSLSYEKMAESGGNIELMYDQLHGWIPIVDHLHSSNPRFPWRKSHVFDYATLWKRAELYLRRVLKLPRRYSHDDVRFRRAWLGGSVDQIRSRRTDRHTKNLRKRKAQMIEIAGQEALPSSSIPSLEEEGIDPMSQEEEVTAPDSVLRNSSPAEEIGGAGGLQAQVESATLMEATDEASSDDSPIQVDRSRVVLLEWSGGANGRRCLTIVGSADPSLLPFSPQPTLITALSKNTEVCQAIRYGDRKCSRCSAGMCPPGIRYCSCCWSHWTHLHCTPLRVNPEGTATYLCSGCSYWSSRNEVTPQHCASCSNLVVDNGSAAYCDGCKRYYHALCAMAANKREKRCFPKGFFDYSFDPRPPWLCAICDENTVEPASPSTPVSTGFELASYRLPILREHGPPGVVIGSHFLLHFPPPYLHKIRCRWQLSPLGVLRHTADFRHLVQFSLMFFPDVRKQTLQELAQNDQCQLLFLQSEEEDGRHWVSFLLFGQNEERGIPVILLQAVHPIFQRQGLGRWALHMLHQRCRKTRYILMNTQPGVDLGFYTHMGFAHFQDAQTRFKMIGGAVWRRPPALGAVMDISLAGVVLESFSTQDPATRHQCRWLCPMGAAFQSIPGTDVCFAATMMHMLLSSPQMVAHFSGYAHRPHSIGSLIGRCLAHMWRSRTQEDPDGPILISLIRQRLTGDFGHATGRSKSTKEPGQSFLGQQDMNELEMALGQALTEDSLCAREEDGRESLDQPTSYAELINSRATEVRYCRKCGSRSLSESTVAWLLPVQDRPVRTLSDLLEPILTTYQEPDRPLDQPGCQRRNCTNRTYIVRTAIRALAPVIQLAVSRGLHAPGTTTMGVRTLHVVDVPLRFTIVSGDTVSLYILRSVSLSSGGPTISSGHYSVGKVFNSVLEHCSHTGKGTSLSIHEIPDSEFLRLDELIPLLPSDHVIAAAWFSLAVGDEQSHHGCGPDMRWQNHDLPELEPFELALSPHELLPRSEGLCTPRTSRSGPSTSPMIWVDALRELVGPETPMRLPRGSGSITDHIHAVREAIQRSELVDVPVLFWMQPDSTGLATLENELSTTMTLSLHTMSTSSGRGRDLLLRSALMEIIRSKAKRDPFTSTNALPEGIYQSAAGIKIMESITMHTGVEVTGGASLLVSEPGVVTPFHFHGPGVLNVHFFLASQQRRTTTLEFRRSEISGTVGCVKQYVLIVTASLEAAGISLYELDTTLSLASLIVRIRRLSTAAREQIRWFYCELDGSEYNALYMPATMCHHVTTLRSSHSKEPFLYIGLATEVLPTDPATRRIMLDKLDRPVHGRRRTASVAGSKHLALQTTSAHSVSLLRYLVRTPSCKVTDFVPWYLARRWASHRRTYGNAQAVWVAGEPVRAEQILLTLLSDKAMVGPLYSNLKSAVQRSQRALSEGLLHTPIPVQLMTTISKSFESGMADTESAAALLPLMLNEVSTEVCIDDSSSSVGVDDAKP